LRSSEFPIIERQRFFKTRLNELFDLNSVVVQEYVKAFDSFKAIADDIIRIIDYPWYLGKPDDTHVWNAFHGTQKWCKRIDADFWQKASETLTIKVGDCEDSSIAFVTAVRAKGLSASNVYEAFGIVRDANTKVLLGGHGWAISKGIPDDKWRLYESTLDIPPAEYPIVENPEKPFRLGNIEYVPEWLFNDKIFKVVGSLDYREREKKDKETHEKYEAIAEAFGIETKPHLKWHERFAGTKRLLRRILRK